MRLLSILLLAWATVALAQDKPGESRLSYSSGQLIDDIDSDKDGFVSREEWARFFAAQDAGGDGILSPEELKLYRQGLQVKEEDRGRENAFKRLDKDGNGLMSRQEWPGGDRFFNRSDANRDGAVSQEEFLSHRAAFWNALFEDWDANNDRIIPRSEWLDSESKFLLTDRDRDGVIDEEEFYSRD
jgi:Ca2+-binding EF-hand superfamily protein